MKVYVFSFLYALAAIGFMFQAWPVMCQRNSESAFMRTVHVGVGGALWPAFWAVRIGSAAVKPGMMDEPLGCEQVEEGK